eukprot:11711893-Alexandrium_andersonii.AAC.1
MVVVMATAWYRGICGHVVDGGVHCESDGGDDDVHGDCGGDGGDGDGGAAADGDSGCHDDDDADDDY